MKFPSKQFHTAVVTARTSNNLLLDSFPAKIQQKLAPHFHKVSLPAGKFLYHPAETVNSLYFPTTAIAVEFAMLADGDGIQTALIGRDALSALSPFLGDNILQFTQVLIAGECLTVDADKFREQFDDSAELRQILLNCLDQYVNRLSTVLLCHIYHQVESRLCRWLLMLAENAGYELPEFLITHQQIACLLGANRPTISITAKNLERQKIISYKRGRLKILDLPELRKRICEY